ncbi:unnamed protein product [Calypogeia fissa]
MNESQGTELAEHAAEAESHMDRLNVSDTGEAEGGMSRTEEEAGVDSGASVVRDDPEEGALLNPNGLIFSDESDLQPRSHTLDSTLKLGDAVEDDAWAVARSLTALLASLKSALSEVTGSSLEHMHSENEAAGQLQDVAIDAATKGNRFINACLRLNEEMKGMNRVATQLESLKQRVDQFEYQSNRYLPRK